MDIPFDLSIAQSAFLAVALVAAAIIRGLSGFGFSAFFLLLAALITDPLPLIPVVFSCEIAMTAFQARGIRAHIDWTRALRLLGGSAVAIFPAVYVMARLDVDMTRLVISGLILGLGGLLISGWRLERRVGRLGTLAVGAAAGMANSAGVGGLVVAAFFSAQPIPPAVFRATLIVFLTGLDLMSLPVMGSQGLAGPETLLGALIAFPLTGLGVWIGSHGFARIPAARFRQIVILLMITLSLLNVIRVLT